MSRKSTASPATLDAIRHLARLGVRGWILIALLAGAVYLADKYLLNGPNPPAPGLGPIVAGPDDPDAPPAGYVPNEPGAADDEDDFGPPPGADTSPDRRTPGRTYDVVAVQFRTADGEAAIDLEPGSVLSRTDGKGLVLAERLSGGERVRTTCGDAATVLSAKESRVAEIRPPPRCPPLAIDPYVEKVTVENFGRPVPAAAPDGEVDLSKTLARIARGESFPHRNDGATFGNREGRLPRQSRGYYHEYVHPTPGVSGPGPQRLVIGEGGDVWYTPDHYDSFRSVVK